MRELPALIERWKQQKLGVLKGQPTHTVQELFARLGSEVSQDVLALYGAVGGMDRDDEKTMWRLWSVAEIQNENTTSSQHGILFSDYFLSCWCFRVRFNNPETSSVVVDHFDGKEPTLVAPTLEMFFTEYVKNAKALLDPGAYARSKK